MKELAVIEGYRNCMFSHLLEIQLLDILDDITRDAQETVLFFCLKPVLFYIKRHGLRKNCISF